MTEDRLNEIRAFEPGTATPQQTGEVLLELTNEVQRLQARLSGLEEDSAVLRALEAAGVDNWDGYSDALSDLD